MNCIVFGRRSDEINWLSWGYKFRLLFIWTVLLFFCECSLRCESGNEWIKDALKFECKCHYHTAFVKLVRCYFRQKIWNHKINELIGLRSLSTKSLMLISFSSKYRKNVWEFVYLCFYDEDETQCIEKFNKYHFLFVYALGWILITMDDECEWAFCVDFTAFFYQWPSKKWRWTFKLIWKMTCRMCMV